MDYNLKQKLGFIIKTNRKNLNMSQQALALKINYNQSIVSKIENGNENVDLCTYVLTLNVFGFDYEKNQEIETKVKRLITEIYDFLYYLNENREELINQYEDIMKWNKDVTLYYDLLCIKTVITYSYRDYESCRDKLKVLNDFYPILDRKTQIAATFMNIYVSKYLDFDNKIKLENPVIEKLEDDGLLRYVTGWKFFQEYNYSKAITYLQEANLIFKRNNNVRRINRSEIMIDHILLNDRHYQDVLTRSLSLLDTETNPRNLSYLYFHIGYCYYHLHQCSLALEYLKRLDNNYEDYHFIRYLISKCDFQLHGTMVNYSNLEVNKQNILIILYFKYLNHRDETFYKLIETYIVPSYKPDFYKTEYQYYVNELLSFYWESKKYTLFHKLNKIVHETFQIA